MFSAEYSLETAKDPKTLSFTRLHYLFSGPTMQYGPALATLGKRLLALNPEDSDVEKCLLNDLQPWRSASNKAEALDYANDLITRHPRDPDVYRSIASYVYLFSWAETYDSSDAKHALVLYKKYLSFPAVSNVDRQRAIRYMGMINRGEAYKAAHPNWNSGAKKSSN